MVRRLAVITLAGVLFLIVALPTAASAAGPPPLRGKAMLLMDGLTGQILYQQNGTMTNFPASTTKLLTALVAVEHGKLEQAIRVSREAVDKGPDSASCYVSEGEEQRLEHLLYGLLLSSGNDCADAIAEGLTNGNPEQFLNWMNETAKRLGATNSHFSNPHGLHEYDHYTTAHDLALIARGALSNPTVRRISSTGEFVWPGKNNGTYYNHNHLLWSYPDETTGKSIIGGKTGFTEAAGFTLVVGAEQKGRVLIGVTLGYEYKSQEFEDMAALLDYGFANFVQVEAVTAGSPQGEIHVAEGKVDKVPVVAQSSFAVTRPANGLQKVTIVPKLESGLKAPVAPGQQVGHLEILDGKQVLGTVPVIASEAVALRPGFWESAGRWSLNILKWIAILSVSLLLFRTVVKTMRRVLRYRRRGYSPGMAARATGTRGMITSYRPRRPR
ncbi:MAG: D-alanyl-D-alanine carboxypeptidase family protein [Bacillota bacterium]